jgi:hypothetical protein
MSRNDRRKQMTAVEIEKDLGSKGSAPERPASSRRPSERKTLRGKSAEGAQVDEIERTFGDRWEW